MKLVINKCFGGFGLSDLAYEKLIEYGVPVEKYIKQKRGKDGIYESNMQGNVIYDKELTRKGEDSLNDSYWDAKSRGSKIMGNRYWEVWLANDRTNPLLIKVVEELGDKANSWAAKLKVVEIPDGTKYEIDEYDGMESIHEQHESWS